MNQVTVEIKLVGSFYSLYVNGVFFKNFSTKDAAIKWLG